MFLYSLQGYDEMSVFRDIILVHEKEFTNDEFIRMCQEAPKLLIDNEIFIEESVLEKYLIKSYGFKKAKQQTNFIFDCVL